MDNSLVAQENPIRIARYRTCCGDPSELRQRPLRFAARVLHRGRSGDVVYAQATFRRRAFVGVGPCGPELAVQHTSVARLGRDREQGRMAPDGDCTSELIIWMPDHETTRVVQCEHPPFVEPFYERDRGAGGMRVAAPTDFRETRRMGRFGAELRHVQLEQGAVQRAHPESAVVATSNVSSCSKSFQDSGEHTYSTLCEKHTAVDTSVIRPSMPSGRTERNKRYQRYVSVPRIDS